MDTHDQERRHKRSQGDNRQKLTEMVQTPEKRLYTKLTEWERSKHPNYPAHLRLPVKRYALNKANGLTQAVIAWIRAHGYQAERVNTMGRPVDNRKEFTDVVGFRRTVGSIDWIPGTGTRGSADIHASIPLKGSNGWAVSVKIEIKIGKDRLSDAQKEYGQQMELAGGVYIVVKTLDDFFKWWDENIV